MVNITRNPFAVDAITFNIVFSGTIIACHHISGLKACFINNQI